MTVDVPDQKGRLEILKVHARNKKLGEDVDLKEVALRTPGFAGADLSNLLNEAAILAGRKSLPVSCAILSPLLPVQTSRVGLVSAVQESGCWCLLGAWHVFACRCFAFAFPGTVRLRAPVKRPLTRVCVCACVCAPLTGYLQH